MVLQGENERRSFPEMVSNSGVVQEGSMGRKASMGNIRCENDDEDEQAECKAWMLRDRTTHEFSRGSCDNGSTARLATAGFTIALRT